VLDNPTKETQNGYYATTDNNEASLMYYKWLETGELPPRLNGVITERQRQNIEEKRKWILANLSMVRNADKIYYAGTALGEKMSHAKALVAYANTHKDKKSENDTTTEQKQVKAVASSSHIF